MGKVYFGAASCLSKPLLPYELFGNKENPLNILGLLTTSLEVVFLLSSQEKLVSDFDHEDHKCLFGLVDSTGHIPSSNFLPSLETGTGGIGTQEVWGEGPRLVQGGLRGFGAEGQDLAGATESPRALSQDKEEQTGLGFLIKGKGPQSGLL